MLAETTMKKLLPALALLPPLLLLAPPCAAQEVSAADAAAAKEHFGKAKEQYQTGNYKAARQELEAAQKLDPTAKELVLNLANVNEKLGAYGDAMKWWEAYKALPTVTADEQKKADQSLRRIEGAKRTADEEEAKRKADEEARRQDELARNKTVVVVEKPVLRKGGRLDALTIGAGAVGVVGLGVGTYFGLKALSDDPGGQALSSSFTYADYKARYDRAHTSANVATGAFAVGVAASVGAVILYFARTSEEPAPEKAGDVSVGVGSLSVRFQ